MLLERIRTKKPWCENKEWVSRILTVKANSRLQNLQILVNISKYPAVYYEEMNRLKKKARGGRKNVVVTDVTEEELANDLEYVNLTS